MKKASAAQRTIETKLFLAAVLMMSFATVGLTGCGKSDAEKQYAALDQKHAPSAEAARANQVIVDPVPGASVIITIDGNGPKDIVVREGQTATISGTARVMGVSFTTELSNKPAGATFNVTTADGVQHWTLTFKGKAGEYSPKIVLKIGQNSDPVVRKDISAGASVLGLKITVTKVTDQPSVNSIAGLDTVNPVEGVAVPFVVDVNDPSSIESNAAPSLAIAGDPAGLALDGAIDVSSFIEADASKPPQNLGNGEWKFFYTYSTAGKALPRPKKHSSVGGDQGLGTFTVTMTTSAKATAKKTHKFNLKFDTQKQTAKFEVKDASQLTVTLGQLNKIDIDVTSDDPAGVLKLLATDTHTALKNLSGQAQAKCDSSSKEATVCHIRWTPTCDAATDKAQTVELKMTNTVGGIAAPVSWAKDVQLVKPENCGVKPTAKPAKTAKTPVSKTSTAAAPKAAAAKPKAAKVAPAAAAAPKAGAKAAVASGTETQTSSGGKK